MTAPRLAVLHHLERPGLGLAGPPLRAAGLELDERFARRRDPLPDLDAVAGVLSLGGEQSARRLERDPWLAAEAALLGEAVARDVPVLAVCLGAQLLAAALGARVRRLPSRTVAWLELEPTAAGRADLVVGAMPAPVAALHFNADGFGLPPGAVELLGPGPSVSAFRAGERAWGVQFHPDVDRAMLDGWYRLGWHAEAGVAEADARAADARAWPRQEAQAEALFGAFARVLRDAVQPGSAWLCSRR